MEIDWQRINAELSAHFEPASVQWRPQGTCKAGAEVQLLASLDARQVAARLDRVCPGWSFDWEPVSVNSNGEVMTAKGRLTIAGCSRSDVGTASIWEPSKGTVSDALKRCAVLFGVGAYLYSLPDVQVTLNADAQVPPVILTRLAEYLKSLTSASQPTGDRVTLTPLLDISDVSTALLPPREEHKLE